MLNFKEELRAIVSVALPVKSGDGILAKNEKVKITASGEVGKITSSADMVVGYVLISNKEDGGLATVVMSGYKISQETTGAAFAAGSLVQVDDQGRAIEASQDNSKARGTITVVDFTWDGGETITINGVVLTEGTDFNAGTSNNATAGEIWAAILRNVPLVTAYVAGDVVHVIALNPGTAGNAITTSTDDDGADVTVDQANLSGGTEYRPFGVAIEDATGADESKYVLWF